MRGINCIQKLPILEVRAKFTLEYPALHIGQIKGTARAAFTEQLCIKNKVIASTSLIVSYDHIIVCYFSLGTFSNKHLAHNN